MAGEAAEQGGDALLVEVDEDVWVRAKLRRRIDYGDGRVRAQCRFPSINEFGFHEFSLPVVDHQGRAVVVLASFETRPKPHMRRQLRSLFLGKLERDCDHEELDRADYWIDKHYLFMVHPDQRPTLEWFLDKAEVAVIRHGARIIQVDPWNRLEAARSRDESETEYIGRCLRSLHVFAHDMNCHVQIVAHPAKMDGPRRGKRPGLEDISGSKNWENMVDQGFVVHRPEIFDGSQRKTEATLYHLKARFDELGYPCKFTLDYKLTSGRYVSTEYAA